MVHENILRLYNEAYARSPEDAFCFAVCEGLFKEAKQLLNEGADIHVKSSSRSGSLICHVVNMGLTRAVQFLIENGANVNELNSNGMTPLMYACSIGKTKGEKIAYMLIEAGADVTYISDLISALTFSFKNGSRQLIKALIDKGANVNGLEGATQTPLMLAARDNNVDAIELLLEHGADPEAKCTLSWAQGLTAEDLAKLEGCKKAYTYLKNYRLSTSK